MTYLSKTVILHGIAEAKDKTRLACRIWGLGVPWALNVLEAASTSAHGRIMDGKCTCEEPRESAGPVNVLPVDQA